MLDEADGGYDNGYRAVTGFWGTKPASLVHEFLSSHNPMGMTVVDVGAGEGKNAAAFAAAGASVDAIECSSAAIRNGKQLFGDQPINWIKADALRVDLKPAHYDVVVCYGLMHCLPSELAAEQLLKMLMTSLKAGGTMILASFNDGSHDLSAHPGFHPLLLQHRWFESAFARWDIIKSTNSLLFETHPHNKIPHHHSLTRIMAVKP